MSTKDKENATRIAVQKEYDKTYVIRSEEAGKSMYNYRSAYQEAQEDNNEAFQRLYHMLGTHYAIDYLVDFSETYRVKCIRIWEDLPTNLEDHLNLAGNSDNNYWFHFSEPGKIVHLTLEAIDQKFGYDSTMGRPDDLRNLLVRRGAITILHKTEGAPKSRKCTLGLNCHNVNQVFWLRWSETLHSI